MASDNTKTDVTYAEIRQNAAKLLIESGYPENAAKLFDSTEFVKEIESLIIKQAPSFSDQDKFSLQHIKQSFQTDNEQGSHYPEVYSCIAIGRSLIELAEYEQAENWLNQVAGLIEQSDSHFLNFNLNLARAEFYLACGNHKAGIATLAEAMTIGSKARLLNTDWWPPDAMCQLCVTALKNHIEVSYVQQLIIKHKLTPASPPLHLDNWPWRLRIYTLGRFSVLLDGKNVSVNGKGKNRQIELLMALIALGGRDVSEAHLCEALWPDAEGDHAHSSFTTTLSRLRKMLSNDILLVHNGQLSLNDQLCWLDTWAWYRALAKLESALAHAETQQTEGIEQQQDRLFSLYHGLFMEKEPQMAWMLPERERLQTRLLRIIRQLISFYSSRGHCDKVITLYEKAQELDPLSEEYYRGLMQCHASSGNNGEALAIYDRCRSILNSTFNIQPSEKTTRLYKTIKSDDSKRLQHYCALCSQNSSA